MSFDENNDEYAIVRIMGYGTAHCVWPKDLMETEGKEARDKQVQAALKDINSQKEEATKLEASANTSGSSDRITVIGKGFFLFKISLMHDDRTVKSPLDHFMLFFLTKVHATTGNSKG